MGRIKRWLDDAYEAIDATLFNRWLWIIIGSMCLIVIVPFTLIIAMAMAPGWLAATITFLIIVGWGFAGGYKEYSLHKRKGEEAKAAKELHPSTYEEYLEQQRHRP
jgi:uncharacterized membrane protein